MDKYSLTWVEISKSALLHNLRQFIKYAGKKAKICPILKANAYGHGIIETAKICQNKPIWGFGVVNLSEALLLRQAGLKKPILVLSYADNDLKAGIRQKVEFSVYSLKFAKELNKAAGQLETKVRIHLKVEVGTNRLGIQPENILNFLKEIKRLKNIELKGIFSHLADSENSNWRFTWQQVNIFDKILREIKEAGINIPLKHLACSAAASSKKTHYNLLRIGLSLYGLWPSLAAKKKFAGKINLKPVLAWRAKIIQVKEVKRGEGIGYGLSYKAKKKLKIAVIPAGYYEGYDRKLSNKNFVLIKGKRCRVLGRVCMNMHMADVSRLAHIKAGDVATLIGQDNKAQITAEEMAQNLKTINYEVVTRINPLIPRIYA